MGWGWPQCSQALQGVPCSGGAGWVRQGRCGISLIAVWALTREAPPVVMLLNHGLLSRKWERVLPR